MLFGDPLLRYVTAMPDGNRPNSGRNAAYSAVAAALSLVMIFLTAYVPVLTVAPLVVCALAWNVVIDKCGVKYGIASMLASVGLGFLTVLGAGFGVMIIVGIVFVPYSLLAYFMKPLTYDKVWKILTRLGTLIVFASLIFICLYFTADAIIGFIDITRIIDNISGGNFWAGYLVLNLIAVAAVIGIDYIFLYMRAYIVKRLK